MDGGGGGGVCVCACMILCFPKDKGIQNQQWRGFGG